MSTWSLGLGKTLLVPSGPQDHSHLFVMVLGPIQIPSYGSQPHVAMVSATTIRPNIPYDNACVLNPGDHPFIQHPSYIAYRWMRFDPSTHVDRMVQTNSWKPHQDCSQALTQKIIDGVCLSKQTPREFKMLFGCSL